MFLTVIKSPTDKLCGFSVVAVTIFVELLKVQLLINLGLRLNNASLIVRSVERVKSFMSLNPVFADS